MDVKNTSKGSFNFLASIANARRPGFNSTPDRLNIDERMKSLKEKSSSGSQDGKNSSGNQKDNISGAMMTLKGRARSLIFLNQRKKDSANL